MDVARHGVNCRVSLGVQHTLLSVLVCLSTSFGRTCLTVLCFELAHTCACLTSKRKTTGNQSEVDIAQPLALSRLVCLAALRWCLPRMGRTPLFASPPFHLQLQLDFSPHYTVDFSEAACEAEGWLWVPLLFTTTREIGPGTGIVKKSRLCMSKQCKRSEPVFDPRQRAAFLRTTKTFAAAPFAKNRSAHM